MSVTKRSLASGRTVEGCIAMPWNQMKLHPNRCKLQVHVCVCASVSLGVCPLQWLLGASFSISCHKQKRFEGGSTMEPKAVTALAWQSLAKDRGEMPSEMKSEAKTRAFHSMSWERHSWLWSLLLDFPLTLIQQVFEHLVAKQHAGTSVNEFCHTSGLSGWRWPKLLCQGCNSSLFNLVYKRNINCSWHDLATEVSWSTLSVWRRLCISWQSFNLFR